MPGCLVRLTDQRRRMTGCKLGRRQTAFKEQQAGLIIRSVRQLLTQRQGCAVRQPGRVLDSLAGCCASGSLLKQDRVTQSGPVMGEFYDGHSKREE